MIYYSCVDTKEVNLIDISQYMISKLGIKLHADFSTDTVNGAITGNHWPAGPKFGMCWGGHDLMDILEEHSCLIIEVYEIDKDPDGLVQKSTIRKKVPNDFSEKKLDKMVDDFCKMKKWKKFNKKDRMGVKEKDAIG